MRLLVLTPFPPDARGRHGGAVYLGTYLEALAARAEVAVACLVSPGDQAAADSLRTRGAFARVELVPHPQLRDLRGLARAAHRGRMLLSWALRGLPLLAAKYRSNHLAERLRTLQREFAPHAVMIEMAVMAQYLPQCAGTPTVLTDHERGDPLAAPIGPGGLGLARDTRLWLPYVRDLYAHATLLQAVSAEDAEHLARRVGRSVEVRPLVVPLPGQAVDPGATPPRALFLGNYLHHPNVETARRLVTEVWPQVRRQIPDAELWLAGAGPGPLADGPLPPGVVWIGQVDQLAELFGQVRLMLAPLFSGGGARVKLLTAMAHGLPVVSNELGLQGTDAPVAAAARAESVTELAAHVCTLLHDPSAAAHAGRAARSWVEQHVSPAALAEAQLARLGELVTRSGRTV